MIKKILIIFFILSLYSCDKKNVYRDFATISDVISYGYKVSKPSILCLIDTEDKLQSINRYNFLVDNFECYIVRDPIKTSIGKIVNPSKFPCYIIIEKDSIVSLIFHEELKVILKNNNKEQIIDALLNSKSNIDNVKYFNILLMLYQKKANYKFTTTSNYLDSLVEKHDTFYGKYLLARMYKNINVKKASEMYNKLWINSTVYDIKKYPEEFLDIMKSKDHLLVINKENIKFDYTEYDFGTILPNKTVSCKFYYTNRDSEKFVIHNITTTCGCTVPFWNKQPIKPNTRDSILVEFKTGNTGINQKTIIVEGNCSKKIKLKIRAFVS